MANSQDLEGKVAAMRGELDAFKYNFQEHKSELKHRERIELFDMIISTLDRICWKLDAIFFLVGVLYVEFFVFCYLIAKKTAG